LPVLLRALATAEPAELSRFVDSNLDRCANPHEGAGLDANWRAGLGAADVQEVADFALTAFYDPSADCGIAEDWLSLSETLTPEAQAALLGSSLRVHEVSFDPGRMGSYFQTAAEAERSLAVLSSATSEHLQAYVSLLREAVRSGRGLYVTF
jgi:hypothetical protein